MKLIERFKKSSFARNVAKLASGTILAQAISILTAPILYRIYDAEAYGTLGLYMAVTGILGPLTTFQLSHAVLIEENVEDAKSAIGHIYRLNLAIAVVCALVLGLAHTGIAQFLGNPEVSLWLLLTPLSVILGGRTEVLKTWANRQKAFNTLTLNALLAAVFVPITSISVGLLTRDVLGLFLGLMVGQLVPYIALEWRFRAQIAKHLSSPTITRAELVNRHKGFIRFSTPAEFVNRLSAQLPVLLLSKFLGPATVGLYNLTVRMLSLPLQLISSAVGEVFKQRATADFNAHGQCIEIYRQARKGLLILALPPVIILSFFGPELFAFFFGEEWRESGVYSQILCWFFGFRFVASPLSYVFFIGQQQRLDFVLQVVYLVLSFIALAGAMYVSKEPHLALAAFSLAGIAFYSLSLWKSWQISKGSLSGTDSGRRAEALI